MTTPHTTPGSVFTPYVPPTEAPKEFSIGAIVLGVLLGLVFAASSIYLALKVSLTVSASIPIAVLSITIFRYVSRAFRAQPATILQNNLVQTTGSAASTAGATSQDLKTGYLVGATPRYQQIGLLIGVTASALLVGGIIQFLNDAKTTIVPKNYPGVQMSVIETNARFALSNGRMVTAADAPATPSYRIGRLYEQLPWGLILIGAFLAIAIEVIGIPSLPVAVGVYLPISTSAAMFLGGVIRWLVDRRMSPEDRHGADADSGPGVLFSSGLIAGGAIMGVVLAGLAARHLDEKFDLGKAMGAMATNNISSIIAYIVLLALPLYLVARRVRSSIS